MNAIASPALPPVQNSQDQDPRDPQPTPWRPLLIRQGCFEFESYGKFLAGFLRLGRFEVHTAWERRGWYWLRNPGSVEVALGRYYAVVSWAPVQ